MGETAGPWSLSENVAEIQQAIDVPKRESLAPQLAAPLAKRARATAGSTLFRLSTADLDGFSPRVGPPTAPELCWGVEDVMDANLVF